ncbi:CDP-alcohol phosphatidyltransferase family protein [bacterium]|nr:CDP-alcohol phosphatidyltransferase family protein [bacterium]
MNKLFILISIVLGLFAIERLIILKLTSSVKGREWIKKTWWMHPNSLCIMRIPNGFITILLWYKVNPTFASLWFSLFMITDLTDGTIARKCDLGTPKGEWLDPLSDKFMYLPVLAMFAWQGYLSVTLVVIFSIIDIIGQFSRLIVKKKAANSFGKAKTTMVCVVLIMIGLKVTCTEAWIVHSALFNRIDYLFCSCCILAFLSFYCKIVPDIWYANSLTFLNFSCGIAALKIAWSGNLILAFVLVFIGQFFDLLDGRAARKYGSTKHGGLFDDIADGISFGFAIGSIIFLSSRAVHLNLSLVISILYTFCVIYRLYRFLKNSGKLPYGIFEGLPSPAGAMLAGSSAILFMKIPSMVLFFAFLSSILMISRIKYKHFGLKIWSLMHVKAKLSIFVIILIYINFSVIQKSYTKSFAFTLFCFAAISIYSILAINRTIEGDSEAVTIDDDEQEDI